MDLNKMTQRQRGIFDLVLRYRLVQIQEWQDSITEILKFFDCYQCGNCCKEIPCMIMPHDLTRIALFLKVKHSTRRMRRFLRKYTTLVKEKTPYLKTPCPFLQHNKCRIYLVRPAACKSFPFNWDDYFLNSITKCPLSKDIMGAYTEWEEKPSEAAIKVMTLTDLDKKIREYRKEIEMFFETGRPKQSRGEVIKKWKTTKDNFLRNIQPKNLPKREHFGEYDLGSYFNPRMIKAFLEDLKRAKEVNKYSKNI